MLDGYRVVASPLLPEYRAPVCKPMRMSVPSGPTEPYADLAVDVYQLVRYIDHTGIPELQYHLKEMRR